jgi:c-di-GMP-binding flagellar brake protein YcgR
MIDERWENRRKDSRAGIAFPVECDLLPTKNYFYTVSKDLSSSGAKIITDRFLAKGEILKIHLNLIDQIVEIKARVAWCNKERVSERYMTGVEFTEINRAKKGTLSKLLSTMVP